MQRTAALDSTALLHSGWFPHGTGRNKFGGAKRRRTITSTPSTPDDDIFAEESDQEELDG